MTLSRLMRNARRNASHMLNSKDNKMFRSDLILAGAGESVRKMERSACRLGGG